ncbi:MAG: hypothetical protein KAJ10_00930 [Thermodesulfovibrionia bacterium]|nr:hypothetical protein [Thermodesulfovibrionia bacterium]
MNFWDKIQKDMKKNIKEGLEFMKEGSTAVSQRLEKLTEEGKKKYKIFNLNMKVQEEFAKLGGQVYDLTTKKSKNPLGNRKVNSIISKINKLETQITRLKKKSVKKTVKKTIRKTKRKSTGQPKKVK